jgi:hypothetical protein
LDGGLVPFAEVQVVVARYAASVKDGIGAAPAQVEDLVEEVLKTRLAEDVGRTEASSQDICKEVESVPATKDLRGVGQLGTGARITLYGKGYREVELGPYLLDDGARLAGHVHRFVHPFRRLALE